MNFDRCNANNYYRHLIKLCTCTNDNNVMNLPECRLQTHKINYNNHNSKVSGSGNKAKISNFKVEVVSCVSLLWYMDCLFW